MPAILAVAILGSGSPAIAQGHDGGEPEWQVALGGIGLLVPAYQGSDDFRLRGYPAADITYRNRFFLNGRHGLGAFIVNTDAARIGFGLFYTGGRDEDDSRDLKGMGDIDGGAEVIAFAEYSSGPYGLDVEALHQITGADTGTRVELGAAYDIWVGQRRALITPGISATYGSGHYMGAYFGITAHQAAASGYAPYEAGAGVKNVRLEATALLFAAERWMLLAIPSLGYLTGDAADSPLVRRRLQPGLILGLLFRL